MVTGAYRPRWVGARSEAGPLCTLTFVINRAHERYTGRLGHDELVRTLATARGALGTSADYLFSTAAHLEQLGIGDHTLLRLCAEVRAYRSPTT
jgi:cation transport protein ChaC